MTENKIVKSREKSKVKIKDKFERWTVLENLGIIKGRVYFKCRCECGNTKTVAGCSLLVGDTKSCGCLQKEIAASIGLKHGMCKTATYYTWDGMLQRCNNPNVPRYFDYGGRGIKVCKRWHKFENFYADMGTKPKGLTIERINNDLGYYKENCKWASYFEQNRNQRVPKNNKTGISGISWYKPSQKYHVRIEANNKQYHIGYFKNLEDAKAARIAAEKKYWT